MGKEKKNKANTMMHYWLGYLWEWQLFLVVTETTSLNHPSKTLKGEVFVCKFLSFRRRVAPWGLPSLSLWVTYVWQLLTLHVSNELPEHEGKCLFGISLRWDTISTKWVDICTVSLTVARLESEMKCSGGEIIYNMVCTIQKLYIF